LSCGVEVLPKATSVLLLVAYTCRLEQKNVYLIFITINYKSSDIGTQIQIQIIWTPYKICFSNHQIVCMENEINQAKKYEIMQNVSQSNRNKLSEVNFILLFTLIFVDRTFS